MSHSAGKSVLITGCSSGIGLHAAKTLQQRGYQVIASCRKHEDVKRLLSDGLKCVIQLDLNSTDSIESAVATTLEHTQGELYALFNNGAYGQPGAVEDLSRSALEKQFNTNLFGTHELTQKLLPVLIKQDSARIIQNSSILGFAAMGFRGAYNASKYALEGLSDTMRIELRDTGVKVSLIEPGPILSQFRANALIKAREELDMVHSRHSESYKQTVARMEKEGPAVPFTLGPEAVTKRVIHALESKRPKVRYYVTTPTYIAAYLKRVLPHKAFDWFVSKI